ncbi:MAG: sugar phosphate nucleotidyltransferase [Nanoarchaeota archaeon]|nr:NTP transferase domain-containing protein [Nanoarchaeota archaeon]MBU1029985.1 NTP transferase domain-containing protein [Nanoarchaeota archaeon]MBU1849244.1 NTP transferase domain-containing protein [Nanoarchaeota archaeon]
MKQAVILAAGKGVRMRPLTDKVPKPLVKVSGKPFLHYLLTNLEKSGFEKVYFVVGYKKEQLIEYIKKSSYNMAFEFIEQEKQLGTGHALKIMEDHIKENFVVLMSDNFYALSDFKKINTKDKYNYVFGYEHEHPEKFGNLKVEEEYLEKILEKTPKPVSNLINIGLYKFTPEIFKELDKVKKSERGEYEVTDAINFLAAKKTVKFIKADCWQDMGCPEDISKMEQFLKNHYEE